MDSEEKKESNYSSIAKWSAIVIISLTGIFFLHTSISTLIDRVTELEVSKDGLKLKSVITPLGKTTLSDGFSSGFNEEGFYKTYVSQDYNFQISWPDNQNWISNDTLGDLSSNASMPLMLTYKNFVDGIKPSINIVTESVDSTIDIKKYLVFSEKALNDSGFVFVNRNTDLVIDTVAQSSLATLTYTKNPEIFLVQKYIIHKGIAYVITTTKLPSHSKLSKAIKKEMRDVFNSFHLVQ
ncbi:MAG: hypothetical protein NT150_06485 [Bacteroidetes bacterium]|nr:hypothetical protein [Bacteroidota bacterium]